MNRGGRKPLTVVATFAEAALVIGFATAPSLWLAIGLSLLAPLANGIGGSAVSCLFLEQVPGSRGPMMSIRKVTAALGSAVGIATAGFVLDAYKYPMIGITMGALGVVSGILFLILAKDPTRIQKHAELDVNVTQI